MILPSFKQGNLCPGQGNCAAIFAASQYILTYALTRSGRQPRFFPPSCQIRNLHVEFMQITYDRQPFHCNFLESSSEVSSANNPMHTGYTWTGAAAPC